MLGRLILMGAWLAAAPSLFPQTATPLAASELLRYSLEETMPQLHRVLGPPVQISDAGPDMVNWFYKTDVLDQHDYSHQMLFRKSDGKLLSITRNFHLAVAVDGLFPAASTRTYSYPSAAKPEWSVRVREMSGGKRLAIAMGTAKPGDTTTQVAIMRREVVAVFLPWLARQLNP